MRWPSDANSASRTRSVVGARRALRRDEAPPTGAPRDHAQAHQLLNRKSTASPRRSCTSSRSCRWRSRSGSASRIARPRPPRRHHDRLVLREPPELQVAPNPAWRSPNTSPAPRISRSRSRRAGSRRSDSTIAGHARLTPRASSGRRTGSTTTLRRPARPGPGAGGAARARSGRRPRSTMTVAFGTSTPTSMTVVATSTSISPARNAAIAASFSVGRHLAVQQPEAQPGELLGPRAARAPRSRPGPRAWPSPPRAGTPRRPGAPPSTSARRRARTTATRSSGPGADDRVRDRRPPGAASRAAPTCRGRRR